MVSGLENAKCKLSSARSIPLSIDQSNKLTIIKIKNIIIPEENLLKVT
jgi:hypothetical protein